MIQLRPGQERGQTQSEWLDSRHTFSFDRYYDPRHMGFHHLRVINEDWVQAGRGFPTHPHRDMEILTYVLEGALEHRDSLGNGSPIRPGEVQRMSAGTGITHSESNPSASELVHLLQIWILPERLALPPSYEQKAFPLDASHGSLLLLAAPDGRDGAVTLHQDVELSAARLRGGEQVEYRLRPGRHAWIQVARGSVSVNGVRMEAGDGAAVSEEGLLAIQASAETEGTARTAGTARAEILLFDLA